MHTSLANQRCRGDACAVCFSPDSLHVLAAYEDGTLQVRDASTGALRLAIQTHKSAINHVCFSPDSNHFASASRDGTVIFWEVGVGTSDIGEHRLQLGKR